MFFLLLDENPCIFVFIVDNGRYWKLKGFVNIFFWEVVGDMDRVVLIGVWIYYLE
jgi:hypothetical protein